MELHLILLQDGMYSLIPTGTILSNSIEVFEYCDIWREQLTTYLEQMNRYIIVRGEFKGAHFFGCLLN